MKYLKILHAPGYAPAFDHIAVEKAESLKPHSYAPSEAYKVVDLLRNRAAYRAVCGRSKTDTRMVDSPSGDAGDNPICVRRELPITRRLHFPVTKPGRPRKYAPERHLYTVTYLWNDHSVTHIAVHPSPLFCGPLAWRKVMRAMQSEVRQARARGDVVVVTGDLQTKRAGKWFTEVGLEVVQDRIDYVAHSPELHVVSRRPINKPAPRFDHPWLLVKFELA